MLRNILFSSIGFVIFLGFSTPSHALFEAQAHLGYQTSDYNFSSIAGDPVNNSLDLKKLDVLGLDLTVGIPFIPFDIGVRYEKLAGEISPNLFYADVKSVRKSILIKRRLFDFFGYFGVLGSIGVSHDNEYTVKSNEVLLQRERPKTDFSYSISLEGGVNLIGIQVGAEVGYLGLKLKGKFETIDLSGPYGKILVGIGF